MQLRSIEGGAFNKWQFSDLETMEIDNVPLTFLCAGTFSGLTKLKMLFLIRVNLKEIERFVLAPVPKLKSITIHHCGNHKLRVDNFFGTINLHYLEKVEISNCNLYDTITAFTFVGLQNITELKLIRNQIVEIGPRSFDTPLRSLNILTLEYNRLRSLSGDLFRMYRNQLLKLNLDNNPWHCDCQMESLRIVLQNMTNVQSKRVICQTPRHRNRWNLFNCSELCYGKRRLTPITAEKIVAKMKSMVSVIQCGRKNVADSYRLQQDVILTKSLFTQVLAVHIIDAILFISTKTKATDFLLIVFETSLTSVESNDKNEYPPCKIWTKHHMNNSAAELNLKPNQIHRICKMEKGLTIRPLDCLTLISIEIEMNADISIEIWISMKDQVTLIVAFALSLLFGFIIGLFLSLAVVRCFPGIVHNKIRRRRNQNQPQHGIKQTLNQFWLVFFIEGNVIFLT